MASRRAAAAAAVASVHPSSQLNHHVHSTDVSSSVPVSVTSSQMRPAEDSTASTNRASLVASNHTMLSNTPGHHHQHVHTIGVPVSGQTQQHDFHPAYRIPGYMEQFYSLQRNSPTASYHGE